MILSRPTRYGDCVALGLGTEVRVCPFVSCGYHTGAALQSCTLRLADDGGMTEAETAAVLGIDRTRVRQIETAALRKLERGGPPTHVALRERGAA